MKTPPPTTLRLVAMITVVTGIHSSSDASTLVTGTGAYPAPPGSNFTGDMGIRAGYLSGPGNPEYAGTAGYTFTVGNFDILISAIGYYDGPNSAAVNVAGYVADGLQNAHQVGIFASSGAIVPGASATIPAGFSTTVADFQFVTLVTPVQLTANTSYIIGGQITMQDSSGGSAGDVFRNGLGSTFGPGVTITNGSYSGEPTNPTLSDGVFQTPNNVGSGYLGGNIIYTIIPEPNTIALGFLGLIAVFATARRRQI
jgi:hypothetical protein